MRRVVFLNTQMRVGSTWLCNMLKGLISGYAFWPRGGQISQRKFRTGGRGVVKLHWADPRIICSGIKRRKNAKTISLTRNLYDTIVSSIFYMRYDKPLMNIKRLKNIKNARVNFGKKYGNLNDKDYLNKFIQIEQDHVKKRFVKPWVMYNNGFKHPKYLLVHYEDLKKNCLKQMIKISDFLGLKVRINQLNKIVERNSFRRKAGRKPGKGVNSAFLRKGVVGDWKNWINDKSKKIIDDLVDECRNEI